MPRILSTRFEPFSPAPHSAAEMRERPILTATRNLLRLGMNRDHPAAGKRPYVRPTFLIERQIPSTKRLAPVTNRLSERLPPIRPVSGIVRSRVVRGAFCPIQLRVRMGLMHLVHHFRRAHISMKRDRVAILAQSLIVEFADRPAP